MTHRRTTFRIALSVLPLLGAIVACSDASDVEPDRSTDAGEQADAALPGDFSDVPDTDDAGPEDPVDDGEIVPVDGDAGPVNAGVVDGGAVDASTVAPGELDAEKETTVSSSAATIKLPTKERTWTWYPLPGATCRDGSQAGFSLNMSSLKTPSKKLLVFFEGGGACFNAATCSANPKRVAHKSASGGILDRANASNPVADWNYVFVPYCTGDVHIGGNANGSVAGVGAQKFVGYANTASYLRALKSALPSTERVLMTGTSGGGFGSVGNYMQAVREFPNTPVNLADDSGPLMGTPAVAACLAEQWRTTWGLEKTIIAECGADCKGKPDYMLRASMHQAKVNSKYAQGLITATADQTIRQFLGFGESACKSYAALTPAEFKAGVLDLRAQHAAYKNYGVYAYDSTRHTLLLSSTYTSTTLGSKSVAAWVGDIVNKDQSANVGP